MALIDLKSDLSRFRKPFQQTPLEQQQRPGRDMDYRVEPINETVPVTPKPFVTAALTDRLQSKTIAPAPQPAEKTSNVVPKPFANSQPRSSDFVPIKLSTVEKKSDFIPTVQSNPDHISTAVSVTRISRLAGRHEAPRTLNVSSLDRDGILLRYEASAGASELNAPKPATSQLDLNAIPTAYQNIIGTGQFAPFKANQSRLDVNAIPNSYQNIIGTGQFAPFDSNQSRLDLNSIPTQYSNLIGNGQFAPFKPNQSQLDRDTIPAAYYPLAGTGQFAPFNPNQSQLDVNSIPTQYSNIINLASPPLLSRDSNYNRDGAILTYDKARTPFSNIPTIVGLFKNNSDRANFELSGNIAINAFRDPDSGAKGFVLRKQEQDPSDFLGVRLGIRYEYPDTVRGGRLWNVRNTRLTYQIDGAVIEPQRAYYYGSKLDKGEGFSFARPYTQINSEIRNGLLADKYTRTNSPSLLDELYRKYGLQATAFNSTYMLQPYVERKIGQLWSLGSNSFDEGLVRGGISTQVKRAAFDVVRLGKFMASPKGLLFIAKQVGLQLTNPKVEGPRLLPTRIYNPLTPVLQAAGIITPIRARRHGLLPYDIPGTYKYGKYKELELSTNAIVQLTIGNRVSTARAAINPLRVPRLIRLYDEAFDLLGVGLPVGLPYPSLTGLAGPNSALGIGVTDIRRYNDTRDKNKWENPQSERVNTSFRNANAPGPAIPLFNTTLNIYSGPAAGPLTARLSNSPDNERSVLKSIYYKREDLGNSATELKKINDPTFTLPKPLYLPKKIDSALNRIYSDQISNGFPAKPFNLSTGDRNRYATTKYEYFKKPPGGSFNDFRDVLADEPNSPGPSRSSKFAAIFGQEGEFTYDKINPEQHFAEGQQISSVGIVPSSYGRNGRDKRDVLNPESFRGDGITQLDYEGDVPAINANGTGPKLITYGDLGLSDGKYKNQNASTVGRDYIKFFFAGPNFVGTGGKDQVLVFRATLDSLTDDFRPTWDSVSVVGRADPLYVYRSYERGISFGFTVAAASRADLKPMWRKLNYLAGYTTPEYNSDGMIGPFMRITIGDYFQETPGFINSLTYTTENDTPWEINLEQDPDNKQMPMVIRVQCNFTIIGDYRPQKNGRFFSLSTRGTPTGPPTENWLFDASV